MIAPKMALWMAIATAGNTLGQPSAAPAAGSPVTTASIEEAKEIPDPGSLAGYIESQSLVMLGAFCIQNYADLAVFKLSKSAVLASVTLDGDGQFGQISWSTRFVSEYDWSLLDSAHPYCDFIVARNAVAALVIGELKGSCDAVSCISWAIDLDDDDGFRVHYLIPLAVSPQVVYESSLIASGEAAYVQRYHVNSDPCSGETPLNDAYRQRISNALSEFADCMKGSVPPITIWNAACFVGCTPLLAATPIAYALCAAGCNALVSAPGIIDLNTCSNALQAAKDNAKDSYCAGLEYQATHCPDRAEPDAVGCP